MVIEKVYRNFHNEYRALTPKQRVADILIDQHGMHYTWQQVFRVYHYTLDDKQNERNKVIKVLKQLNFGL